MARQIITPTSITMAGLMSVLSLWAKKFRVPFVKYCLTQLNIEMCPNTTSANNRFKALILFFSLSVTECGLEQRFDLPNVCLYPGLHSELNQEMAVVNRILSLYITFGLI